MANPNFWLLLRSGERESDPQTHAHILTIKGTDLQLASRRLPQSGTVSTLSTVSLTPVL